MAASSCLQLSCITSSKNTLETEENNCCHAKSKMFAIVA